MLALYLIVAMAWIQISKSGFDVSPHTPPTVNISGQIEFIKSNPLTFCGIMYNSLIYPYLYNYYISFIGVLGWLIIILPNWFYNLYGILLLTGAIFGNLNLKKPERALMFFLSAPTIITLLIFYYVTWTPVGDPIVQGLQGRYFIPLAVVFLTSLSFLKNNPYEIVLALPAGILSSLVTIISIIEQFYI